MNEGLFYDTMRQGLWVATTSAFPILAVALAVGLIVGLFQALTSVQEMTLTFVPKLGAIILMFWATMGYITQGLVSFFQGTLVPIISGG